MTGQPTPAPAAAPPALAAPQVATLLDHVIYEQVLACIDLDALYSLEQSLTLLAGDLDGVDPDHAADLAKAMLDRALLRVPDDVRRYLRNADWLPFEDCALCQEEVRQTHRAATTGGTRRSTRLKS